MEAEASDPTMVSRHVMPSYAFSLTEEGAVLLTCQDHGNGEVFGTSENGGRHRFLYSGPRVLVRVGTLAVEY